LERIAVTVAFEIHPDSFEMLLRAAEQYKIGFPIPLRRYRLLDYAATEGDWDAIFRKVWCRRCV
jgi:hypothetical protein